MANNIFTFWEGDMPAYIKLCLDTWFFDYTLITYENLHQFTKLDINTLKKYSLPIISDIIRVHVLRDHGGYWLDADTIMVSDYLPTADMMGYPEERSAHIGYLRTEPHSPMFEEWAKFQDKQINLKIANPDFVSAAWDMMGNSFTDTYIKKHKEVIIGSAKFRTPEVYMENNTSRREKYLQFYFSHNFKLDDIQPTDMLMLHNSWTPQWYKDLTEADILKQPCTLSNILKEVLHK